MHIVTGPDNDKEAIIRQMVETHQTPLMRLCYLYLHDVQLAEDAVQETFIKAARTLDKFRGEASMKTWLTSIAMRTCCDMRRSFWFRRMDRRVTPEMLPDPVQSPLEEETALTVAVMNLPQKEREVILLYYYQDMNVNEIARTLGVTQPTVSYRLKRAREKLRQELEGREEP
ncbi:MAG: sigma-70 family RNA polymerase sigma factor [Clostridia bacterium]|nr:sigma-70 family RNA polymerase sigma factor [Clostridia bacterium]